jgi:hypothetical protein
MLATFWLDGLMIFSEGTDPYSRILFELTLSFKQHPSPSRFSDGNRFDGPSDT